jgi:hypothetical protein
LGEAARPVVDEGVAKDRAAPFGRKHAKYWFTVTGGMIAIGLINIAIGYWFYTPQGDPPERIIAVPAPPPPPPPPLPEGTISLGEIPLPVMRAFVQQFPQRAPQTARKLADDLYELTFVAPGATTSETAKFTAAGAVVR